MNKLPAFLTANTGLVCITYAGAHHITIGLAALFLTLVFYPPFTQTKP